jgi:chemotaxis protein CheY-P-specific phosphatase CheC
MNFLQFQESAKQGLESARATLSVFTGKELRLDAVTTDYVELSKVPLLSGSPEDVVLSSYVTFSGDAEGQLMILFRPDSAQKLADCLVPELFRSLSQEEIPSLLDSLMVEVANIVGSSVLNKVADRGGMRLVPTPPVMVRDMSGAILGSAMSYSGTVGNQVYVAYIKFSLGDGKASFEVVFLPKPSARKNGLWVTK